MTFTSQNGYITYPADTNMLNSQSHHGDDDRQPSVTSGSAKCPWRIKVETGQQVNLTAFVFQHHQQQLDTAAACRRRLIIEDGGQLHDVTFCRAAFRRERALYVSKSNHISLYLTGLPNQFQDGGTDSFRFILRYTGASGF